MFTKKIEIKCFYAKIKHNSSHVFINQMKLNENYSNKADKILQIQTKSKQNKT